MRSPGLQVVIVSRIYLPEPSAASFFLSTLAAELVDRSHDVTVLTVRPPKGYAVPERPEALRLFPVLRDRSGYVRGYLQYLSFDVPLAFRLLFRKRPDVVVVEPPPTTGAVVRAICRLRGIPYVYDAADLWSVAAAHATSSSLVLRTLERLERWAIGGADRVITISASVADRIRAWGIRKPVDVTGRGADTAQFRYSPAPLRTEFVYAGSASAWHGAIVLVDAFAEFSSTHPEYVLRFIGHGTEHPAIAARAEELGISDSIVFDEPVEPAELARELSGATASLATLLPDGGYEFAFATKAYSSLASGCPVIFAGPGPTAAFLDAASATAPVGTAVDYTPEAIAEAMRTVAERPVLPESRPGLSEWADQHVSMRAAARRAADAIELSGSQPRRKRARS
ncbi:hypothetical protein BMH32_14190 [Leucobacter sp. OLJS4]|nr:hypothetical protein BMH25_05535 [Leucobacter sp. OLCALW19]PII92523.1 hypothetical protein BMH27_04910 [Leucobacter sp. OLAS13]PII95678.1 hypothetical protein BMH26_01700 [Leucobacter sp. OLTLW20]PII98858.1 hypothetical protein BMH28_12065 [Leucobacter sp. OLCS4]PII99815.1 hypothetical protein BMH29_04715 [Leucobacter sp. OLDS2]PIJ02709.1 hypothetical protein BMH31_09750 [Leucobacter sp. OLIS6]PIJ06322.1 hypothetical protein BMH32_14190 [Leucobacter sp. OLJS4]PIJ57289.1 hypothetical prote